METLEIRDRRSGFLWLSNSFFDSFIKHLQPSSLIVYLGLARFANNETQGCFPSYEKLSETTGLSRSSVAKSLQELKDNGLIRWEKEGRHNVYYLLDTTSPKNGLVHSRSTNSPVEASEQSTGVDPNKTYNKTKEQDLNTLSSPSVPTGEFKLDSEPTPPPRKKKQSTADPRHHRFMELIDRAHKHFVHVPPVLNGGAGKNLQRLLKDCPKLDESRFVKMLEFYHQSDDHAPAESPMAYIPKLPRYETGSLNKFGRSDAVS